MFLHRCNIGDVGGSETPTLCERPCKQPRRGAQPGRNKAYDGFTPIIAAYDGLLRWISVSTKPASSSNFFSCSGE